MTIHFIDDSEPTDEVPIRGVPQKRVRWEWLVIGLSGLSVIVWLLIIRWGSPDRTLTAALAGFFPILVPIPLLIGVLGSWFSRSNIARGLAAVVVAAVVFTTSPFDAVIGCRADNDRLDAGNAITVYTANVYFVSNGGRPADVAQSIMAQRPDVVVLQEVRWGFLEGLRSEAGLADYPHRTDERDGLPINELIWSRWPFVDTSVVEIADQKFVRATIAGPTGDFTVMAVHTQAPTSRAHIGRWKEQLAGLETVDRSTPQLLAGDFNATMDHRPFRDLVNAGWTDVHERKGCGPDNTWPVGQRLPFPVMRLDHVLVTDHFDVLDVRFGDPAGSDHLPVVTAVELRQ